MITKPITLHLIPREDGGLRIKADELPGLILSSLDQAALFRDLPEVIRDLIAYGGYTPPLPSGGDVGEIRKRCDAATKGPWLAAASPSSIVGWPIVSTGAMGRSIGDVSWLPTIKRGTAAYAEIEANAQFIAHARTDIPKLLAALTASEAERERVRMKLQDLCPGHVASVADPKNCNRCGIHIDELRPEENDA